MSDYEEFLASKAQLGTFDGFEPIWIPEFLFGFQVDLIVWAIRKGKAAIFADCGLGKSPMALVFAQNIVLKTNRPVLIITFLAVADQFLREAAKFGIEAHRSTAGEVYPGINIVNYERLHLLDPANYAGAIADESSAIKNFMGKRRTEVTEFMRKMRYRLLCTATAAPNDYFELGTSSEALGELGYIDMLQRFFKNEQNSIKPTIYRHRGENFAKLDDAAKWRFKGHAEVPFWQWVSSWARALRRPSDMGFSDEGFVLPPLIERAHIVGANTLADGMLFAFPAVGLDEQREERRRTIRERCEKAAALVADTGKPALVWCDLNDEGDLLERLIPGCVQVSGKDGDEAKEEKFNAFTLKQARVFITKRKIGAWGMNWQHCAHVVEFPTNSWEQHYQGVRRCWRFGQTETVVNDLVATEGDGEVLKNQQRKAVAADKMFSALVEHMHSAVAIERGNNYTKTVELPSWL